MNTDRPKHKETTDIILKSFYEVYNGQLVPLTLHMRLINQLLEDPPTSPQGEADAGQEINIEVGLLLNFGRKPEFKRPVCVQRTGRFVYDNKRKKSAVISVDRWLSNYG